MRWWEVPAPVVDRTPLPGHDPGTWDNPGTCGCPDCQWLRLTD
jgi:hypothetical protein